MDIGGRKMAGFASGVIDSFQYYGTAIALPVTGWLLDKYGWSAWYPVMAGFRRYRWLFHAVGDAQTAPDARRSAEARRGERQRFRRDRVALSIFERRPSKVSGARRCPRRLQPASKSARICSAKIPSPTIRVLKRGSFNRSPPRRCRMRPSIFSLRSGKCSSSQRSKSGATASGSLTTV